MKINGIEVRAVLEVKTNMKIEVGEHFILDRLHYEQAMQVLKVEEIGRNKVDLYLGDVAYEYEVAK